MTRKIQNDDSADGIWPEAGYTREAGRLIAAMNHVRSGTVRLVRTLSVDEIDRTTGMIRNTIGMLLGHIIALEKRYRVGCFEQRSFTALEDDEWGPGLALSDVRASSRFRGYPSQYYIDALEDERRQTAKCFRECGDKWLDTQVYRNGAKLNYYWFWLHLMEDECSHRGQMLIMVKYNWQSLL